MLKMLKIILKILTNAKNDIKNAKKMPKMILTMLTNAKNDIKNANKCQNLF